MKETGESKRDVYILAGIIALAFLLRFYRLGYQSFWTDELLSINQTLTPPGVPFWRKVLWDVHGPLYSVILYVMRRLSSSAAVLRAPSAVAGTLSVLFMHRWFVLQGKRALAPAAALLLAVSPFNIYYSQELRFYSLLVLFAVLSFIALERFLAEPSTRRGILLGVTLAFACLSHFSAVFLCVGFAVYLLVTGRLRGRVARSGALAALILLVMIAPWIYREIYFLRTVSIVDVSTLPVEERLRGSQTLNPWSYPYTLFAFSVGYSLGPDLRQLHEIRSGLALMGSYAPELLITFILFGWLFVAGVVNSIRRGRGLLFLTVGLITLFAVTLIAANNIKVYNVRYLSCAFPVFIAFLAYGVPGRRSLRWLLLAVACAVMLLSTYNYYMIPRYARDDVRGAAAIVSEHEEPGDLVLVLTVKDTFDYYYDGASEVYAVFPSRIGARRTEELIRERLRSSSRVWLLRCRYWDADPDDVLFGQLESRMRRTSFYELPGIRLYLFEK